jgi:hypothetical protein
MHLPLDALSILTTRLVALPIFRRATPLSSESEVVRRFCPDIDTVRALRPTPKLSAFLGDRLAKAEAHMATLSAEDQIRLTPRLRELRNAVAKMDCKACAGPRGHQCAGVDERRDDQQIDANGLCLGLIREIQAHTVDTVKFALVAWVWGGDDVAIMPLRHRWATDWTDNAGRQLPTTEWKVESTTEFLDDNSSRLSEIRLTLAIEEFDWDSLLAVAWLFTHEFVCHVQQVPPLGGQAREACRPYCPFFEGWMDEVAHRLFEADLISGWLGPTKSGFLKRHREEVVQAASDFRRDRYGTGPGANRWIVARQWDLGAEAARTVREFLEFTSPHHEEEACRRVALAQLVALSFRIQVAMTSTDELDKVVSACLLAGSLGLITAARTAFRAQLLQLLTQPITRLSSWINELDELCGKENV